MPRRSGTAARGAMGHWRQGTARSWADVEALEWWSLQSGSLEALKQHRVSLDRAKRAQIGRGLQQHGMAEQL